jgi:type I restriction enzyme M protein
VVRLDSLYALNAAQSARRTLDPCSTASRHISGYAVGRSCAVADGSFRALLTSPEESFELALIILAWAKLSSSESIPQRLRLDSEVLSDPADALRRWNEMGELNPERYRAFGEAKRLNIDPMLLRPALHLAIRLTDAGLAGEFGDESLAKLSDRILGNDLPPEVATLLLDLADIRPGDTVYAPWDKGGQLSEKAASRKAKAYLETPLPSAIPELVSLLASDAFEVHHADPIRSPSAIEMGKPRKFDVAVAFSPLGMRYEGDTVKRDWLGRLREVTASGAVLSVRHLLSQASRRVVVAVPNSLFFSEGTELSLRLELVEEGIVEAVIAMPSGLLASSNVGFSILVLNPAGGSEKIRFINAEAARFHDAVSKAKHRLVNLTSLVELSSMPSPSDDAATVSKDYVLSKNAQLQVSRYLISQSSRSFESMLDDTNMDFLQDVVNALRPMLTTTKKNDASIEAQEVGAADLPSFGYITRPDRSVLIDAEIADKNKDNF